MVLRPVRSRRCRFGPLAGITQPYSWIPPAPGRASDPPDEASPRKPGVLVVEEEGSFRTVLTLLLRQHGFAVWQAEGAEHALGVPAQRLQVIDVVLLASTLPGPDVPGLVQALRGLNPELSCYLLRGRPNEFSDDALRELGVAGCFTRPFQLADIVAQLQLSIAGEAPPRPPAARPQPEARPVQVEAAEPPGAERRGGVRYHCELENTCQPFGQSHSGEYWPGQIVNLSVGGARVLLGRRFEIGSVLVFSVADAAGEVHQRMLGRVVRVVPEADGRWSLGCSFTHPLEDDHLRELLR